MRLSSIGTILLGTGTAVAILGAAVIGIGVRVDLPPAVQTLIFFKLLFIGAAGLIVAGAVLGRLARRTGRVHDAAPPELAAPSPLTEPRPKSADQDRVRDRAG